MISITEKAAENIKTLREEYGAHDSIFRFGISGGGCSGYKYIMEFGAEEDNDVIFNSQGVAIHVKKNHLDKIKNSIIDWEDSLMSSGFEILNPQAKFLYLNYLSI